jgi:hypothetical protein
MSIVNFFRLLNESDLLAKVLNEAYGTYGLIKSQT